MKRNCKDCDFVIGGKVCELCREPSIYDDMGIDEEQIRADERAKINKHIDELKEIYSLMVKYFSWVNIFNEKTELEKLALKISTDGMQVLGSIIDEYKGTIEDARVEMEIAYHLTYEAIYNKGKADERERIYRMIDECDPHEDAYGYDVLFCDEVIDIIEGGEE